MAKFESVNEFHDQNQEYQGERSPLYVSKGELDDSEACHQKEERAQRKRN